MDTSECIAGLRAVAPAVPPVVPVGMLFGATAVQTGFTPASATALSLFAFAGTAQLATVELLREGATLRVVLATMVLINLRYVIFSASLAPKVRHLSRSWRALVAYPLFDLNYGLAEARFEAVDPQEGHRGWYMVGVSLPLVAALVAGTLVGRVVGDGVQLDVANPLVFISLLAPQVARTPAARAAAAGLVVAVAGADLPANLGLLVAVFCGTAVGVLAAGRPRGRPR
jgi:4-azaleucine resistance transporter AzlC